MEPHEWPDDITKWPVSMARGQGLMGSAGWHLHPTVQRHSSAAGRAGPLLQLLLLVTNTSSGQPCSAQPRLKAFQQQKLSCVS